MSSPTDRQPPRAGAPKCPVSVVILTYNEEENIAQALSSVTGWATEVIVLDSFSTDKTVEIARRSGCRIVQRTFTSFPEQRNHAIRSVDAREEWMLFLDADEWIPAALRSEISGLLDSSPLENGFYIRRRFYWMGRWIKRGYYPTTLLRLFRREYALCEERSVNEHIAVVGRTGILRNDFIHEDHKSVSAWILKHDSYAKMEARESYRDTPSPFAAAPGQESRKDVRRGRRRLWDRTPLIIRPFIYFCYRYVLCGGFLEGIPALCYHTLHALWYRLLIDLYILESKASREPRTTTPSCAE